MSPYYVVHMQNLSHAGEDWLSAEAFRYGASGMSEVLGFRQPEGEEDVYTEVSDARAVDIYFPQTPSAEFLGLLRTQCPEARFSVTAEEEKDWLAEWKKGFAPFALTPEHWVVPSWCEPPLEARHKILIDPGMAFGTGTHETTQLVARHLNRLGVRDSLLDVGTGTGILAILARQLGYKKVAATEIESEARRVARENFALNFAQEIRLDERQVEDLNEAYDVVVANIIDGVLVRIQEALKSRVKPGGQLVLSGIITERERDFLNGFKLPPGRSWEAREQQGDWLLYSVRL